MMLMRKILKAPICPAALILSAAALLFSASPASAQIVVHEDQSMRFGEAVVKDNNSVYTITLDSNGNYSSDAEIVFTIPPREGVYRVTGLTSLAVINNVTVQVDQQMLGPGQDFTIGNFDIDFPPNADINGTAIISIGAELSTSGNGTGYTPSSNYEAEMTLIIDHL